MKLKHKFHAIRSESDGFKFASKTAPVEEDPKMLIWDFCILTS